MQGQCQLALQSFTQLKELVIDVPSMLLQSMLRHIHHLRSLETCQLSDQVNTAVDIAALDFSQLALLPKLGSMSIKKSGLTLTAAQVGQLAACQSLSDLNAGSWSLDAAIGQPNYAQQVDAHLGELVRSVLARPALAAAAGREPVPFQKLDLETTAMTPAVWHHISQLPDLTELNAWWSLDLAAADWKKLSSC